MDNMDVVHPCPHVPQGEGRSEGLVHKSTGFFPDNQLINCTYCSNTYPENGVLPTNFAEEPEKLPSQLTAKNLPIEYCPRIGLTSRCNVTVSDDAIVGDGQPGCH